MPATRLNVERLAPRSIPARKLAMLSAAFLIAVSTVFVASPAYAATFADGGHRV